MRSALLLLLGAVSTGAEADGPDCGNHPVMMATKDDGTTIGIVITDEQRKKSPTWNIESGEPPLSISKAAAAAKAWGKKPYTRYDDVRIHSISFSSIGCTSESVFGSGYFAAVLMVGTVVGPVPVKRDF